MVRGSKHVVKRGNRCWVLVPAEAHQLLENIPTNAGGTPGQPTSGTGRSSASLFTACARISAAALEPLLRNWIPKLMSAGRIRDGDCEMRFWDTKPYGKVVSGQVHRSGSRRDVFETSCSLNSKAGYAGKRQLPHVAKIMMGRASPTPGSVFRHARNLELRLP